MDGQWLTYGEAAVRLGVSIDAIRRRAARGHWARMPGNDGKARVQVPDGVPVSRLGAAQDDAPTLVSALEAHIATLKANVERLTAELATEKTARRTDQEQLGAARAVIDEMTAELVSERDRAEEKIAVIEARLREETARADQAATARRDVTSELVGERAARRASEKLAGQRDADIIILRKDQAAQLAQRDEQLAAARAAADRATADLVALAQRLTAIAEERTSHEEVLEPPRRGRLGRAWEWFLQN